MKEEVRRVKITVNSLGQCSALHFKSGRKASEYMKMREGESRREAIEQVP